MTNDRRNGTVADIIAFYFAHAEREYDKRELQQFRQALRPLLALFHRLLVVQFTAARTSTTHRERERTGATRCDCAHKELRSEFPY